MEMAYLAVCIYYYLVHKVARMGYFRAFFTIYFKFSSVLSIYVSRKKALFFTCELPRIFTNKKVARRNKTI